MEILDELTERDEQGGALGRHSVMLVALILMMFALPVLEWAPGRGARFPILFCLVLLAAVYMNRTQKWMLWAAIFVGGAAAVGLATAHATGSGTLRITAEVLGLILLAFTTFVLLNTLLQTRRVVLDTIVGGVCVYLLMGLCYAVVYRLLIDLDPGAILQGGNPLAVLPDDPSSLPARLLYFSFITLTTVGFGDITPHDELAQMVSASEAIMGQLYLAIFIARLMTLYLTNELSRRGGEGPV